MARRLMAGVALGTLAVTGFAIMSIPAQADSAAAELEVSVGLTGAVPGADASGTVNLAGPGLVPVTVHGADGVDVTEIDPGTVTLDDTPAVRAADGAVIRHLNDVDGDGREDLVVHFDKQRLVSAGDLGPDTAELTLEASVDGAVDTGEAAVRPEVSLEIKFDEAYQARGSGDALRSASGRSLERAQAVLDQHGASALTPFVAAADVAPLAAATARAEARSAGPLPDLASWYTLTLPADTDVDAVLAELLALPEIVHAYPSPEAAPPPMEEPVEPTPDFTALQGYLGTADARNGIDGDFSRQDVRNRGAGIKIVDLEYNWNPFHEDLQLDWSSDVGQGRFVRIDTFGDEHGTAVFGEVSGVANAFGVTGGVPDAEIYGISPVELLPNGNTPWRPGPALAFLAAMQDADGQSFIQPGDAVLLEQQTSSPLGGSRYAPLEWIAAVYDANQVLTAMGANVVLTGGNGNTNTDDPMYTRNGIKWFDPAVHPSDTIFVGAGASGQGSQPARSRLSFSNYGQQFDLQGWGQHITTTGYCTLFCVEDDHNRRYSNSFSGTSGAGPIVTNAVVAIQSYVKSTGQGPWTSAQIMDVLKATGRPQTTNTTEHVGPLPDLRAALKSIEVDAPDTTLLLDQRPFRTGGYVNPRISLPADDGWGSGVDRVEYRLDGGPWTTYNGQFRLYGTGERALSYRAVDNNGNAEEPTTVVISNRGRGSGPDEG